MSFRTGLLELVDKIRRVPGLMDLRQHTVTVRVITWTGARTGLGTKTATDTVLYVGGNQNVKVRELTGEDVVASGGLYSSGDLEIGPITPSYGAGGVAQSALDPAVSVSPTEIYYKIVGPIASASAGDWYKKIGGRSDRNFRYTVVVRKVAAVP